MTTNSFAQKVIIAINFCKEQRSAVNDIFYLSSLRHIDKVYLDASIIPTDIIDGLKETWCECYKSLSEEGFTLSEKSKEHLNYWQEFLAQPSFQMH